MVDWIFTSPCAAYNLVRMRNLMAAAFSRASKSGRGSLHALQRQRDTQTRKPGEIKLTSKNRSPGKGNLLVTQFFSSLIGSLVQKRLGKGMLQKTSALFL